MSNTISPPSAHLRIDRRDAGWASPCAPSIHANPRATLHPAAQPAARVRWKAGTCSMSRNVSGSRKVLCSSFVRKLPVTGASISVMDTRGQQSSLCSSNATAAKIDEVQFELGEGPQWEALKTRSYVLIPDLRSRETNDWPMFAEAIEALESRALFTLPLLLGAATVGVVTLYNDEPGMLSREQFRLARSIAASITWQAVSDAISSADLDRKVETATSPAMRREVHQATGIVIAQLDVSATTAFARLQARAFASGQSLQSVAHDVVVNQLDFRFWEE